MLNEAVDGRPQLVPYRLPELLAAPEQMVFVVEGEKDADRLTGLGLVATTAPGGAGKWPECLTPFFRGRDVVILPDNDPPGEAHARKVAEAIGPVASSVKIVALQGLPPKGDVSDFLDQGGTAGALERLAHAALRVDGPRSATGRCSRAWRTSKAAPSNGFGPM